jgi:hypothetical protein
VFAKSATAISHVATIRARNGTRSLELSRIRVVFVISACAAGFLLGGVWVAATAAAIAPLALGVVRVVRPP